jgi:hypothetical protein
VMVMTNTEIERGEKCLSLDGVSGIVYTVEDMNHSNPSMMVTVRLCALLLIEKESTTTRFTNVSQNGKYPLTFRA